MHLGLTYQLIRLIADLGLVRTLSDAQIRAEVLALRHQLRVFERRVGKPGWQPGYRLLLAALSRLLPCSGWRQYVHVAMTAESRRLLAPDINRRKHTFPLQER